MMQYIEDEENLNDSKHASDPACSIAYRHYFSDVEADAAKLITFSEEKQIKYRVRFRDQYVSQPRAELREVARGGAVAIFDVIQGPFTM